MVEGYTVGSVMGALTEFVYVGRVRLNGVELKDGYNIMAS
jgi:hypothetical protein